MSNDVLAGKVALVTGAADGIGKAITLAFAAEGAHVLAVDKTDMSVDAQLDHERITLMTTDLTAPGAVAAVLEKADRAWGRIDVLVNNAGVASFIPLEETSDEQFEAVMQINVSVVFRFCRDAAPLLKASDGGRIINIGSVMSDFGGVGLTAYAASKHAVAGITKCVASELGPFGITANYIQPGAIVTGITREGFESDPAFRQYWENRAAIGRLGQPEDIAPVAVFLASPAAAFVSGRGLLVDGGAMQSA